ncbi:MAG: glycosyltransferase family 4 protein [Verrucomicrobia bacterium]|nr:glycosyltransferase family 4 protein [Verrucomicrobiota bacterium]
MNCLFLCRRLAGYFHNCIRCFAEVEPRAQVRIVAHPNADNAPFRFEEHSRIEILSRNEFPDDSLDAVIGGIAPDFIYLAGWGDPLYRKIGRQFRSRIPVVMGMDNQWKGTAKQQVMSHLLWPWVHTFCNRIWIPGLYQYEYARRLGFDRSRILTGMYAADCERYWNIGEARDFRSSTKKLLFIGNMWEDKGVVELVDAFGELAKTFPSWRFVLVGGGPLVETYRNTSDRIDVLGFLQPGQMAELIAGCHAFCLPSYHDAWAVVIHEACCMGLPVVATDVCGAASAFVHEGYNGFQCAARNKESLQAALQKLLSQPDDELAEFGRRSRLLSGQITPEAWAAKVSSLLG